jgi:hypothetical protein
MSSDHRLKIYLNLDNLIELREGSEGPSPDDPERDEILRAHGFDGVQITGFDPGPPLTLPFCGLNRINQPEDAEKILTQHVQRGDECVTLHVGWGLENDKEIDLLIEAILKASNSLGLPVYFETHRATIFQDIWRTVEAIKRFPTLEFNLDFSHFYCGQELRYGDWESKLNFLQPIFERTRFIHARIASSGMMQMPIDPDFLQRPEGAVGETDYLADFREVWIRTMKAFRKNTPMKSSLIFAPELLSGRYYYARCLPSGRGKTAICEESDRYAQALIYAKLALWCWEQSATDQSTS